MFHYKLLLFPQTFECIKQTIDILNPFSLNTHPLQFAFFFTKEWYNNGTHIKLSINISTDLTLIILNNLIKFFKLSLVFCVFEYSE